MRFIILAALASAAMGNAQVASAQVPAAPTSGWSTTLDVNTPIETLMADPAAKAVLERDLPGIGSHPSYESFKSMSVVQVQPMSDGAITPQMLALVDKDLKALRHSARN